MFRSTESLTDFAGAAAEVVALLAWLMFVGILAWMVWHYIKPIRHYSRFQSKLYILEEAMLEKVGKKKGVDLDKELRKHEMSVSNKFKKRIEAEIMAEMEGKKIKEESD